MPRATYPPAIRGNWRFLYHRGGRVELGVDSIYGPFGVPESAGPTRTRLRTTLINSHEYIDPEISETEDEAIIAEVMSNEPPRPIPMVLCPPHYAVNSVTVASIPDANSPTKIQAVGLNSISCVKVADEVGGVQIHGAEKVVVNASVDPNDPNA